MRLVAAIFLTITATSALAGGGTYGSQGDIAVGFISETADGVDWLRQPEKHSGILGQTEGSNWRYRSEGTRTEQAVGYEAEYEIEGNDWFRQPPRHVGEWNGVN